MYILGKVAGSAAIINKEKEILLLKRSSGSKNFPDCWTFPAGGVEETDDSISTCVVREVKEETGLDFIVTEKFNFYDGVVNNKRYVSLLHLGTFSGKLSINFESDESGFFSYDQAKKLDIAFSYHQALDDLHNAGLI